MTKRMLIDATHSEETRVAVVDGNRLDDFDFEFESRKQLKGNIYLAIVTRVEPSLQAAFVEYGGNRHGFLPFPEIHPDYYRIPVADKEAMLAAEKEAARAEEDEDDIIAESASKEGEAEGAVEELGGDDATLEEEVTPRRRKRPTARDYSIQEVIKRRQVMLIQINKEERGSKGAALTTYLSLPGRYCVLMPNSAHGGGVSRKIANAADRKRMKDVLSMLDVPEGMSVILRTAGLSRNKAEIRRDFDYLLRLWDQIRETTLESSAPTLIYEEGDLVKRAMRDLYTRDIDEVLVAGDDGYREAKDYMKMIIPSHAKKVQAYKDDSLPLFFRYQVEAQIDAIHSPTVELKSGGYIVINQTEALVAVDVNSGRATRERSIEETALKTNIEAAQEIARQLRLRDMAGLIVIDFIDMEETKNNITVERKLKEALKQDRARIQVGRISHFGLLEMSRQRLRPSLGETSFSPCPHCKGTGSLRSIESSALHVLRALEEEGMRQRSSRIKLFTPTDLALYILNDKRQTLGEIERRYQFRIQIEQDDSLVRPDFRLERSRLSKEELAELENISIQAPVQPAPEQDVSADVEEVDVADDIDDAETKEQAEDERQPRRRRRGGRRRNGRRGEEKADMQAEADDEEKQDQSAIQKAAADSDSEEDGGRGKRRRGRRGGRRRKKREDEATATTEAAPATPDAEMTATDKDGDAETASPAPSGKEAPRRRRRNTSAPRGNKADKEATAKHLELTGGVGPIQPPKLADEKGEGESGKKSGWLSRILS